MGSRCWVLHWNRDDVTVFGLVFAEKACCIHLSQDKCVGWQNKKQTPTEIELQEPVKNGRE
jgi:hypothetical protein